MQRLYPREFNYPVIYPVELHINIFHQESKRFRKLNAGPAFVRVMFHVWKHLR